MRERTQPVRKYSAEMTQLDVANIILRSIPEDSTISVKRIKAQLGLPHGIRSIHSIIQCFHKGKVEIIRKYGYTKYRRLKNV